MSRFVTSIKKSALLLLPLVLLLAGLPTCQAQQINLRLAEDSVATSYATYQVVDDTSSHPGLGLRYSIEQDWFLFGEAHHANHVPLTQDSDLQLSPNAKFRKSAPIDVSHEWQ